MHVPYDSYLIAHRVRVSMLTSSLRSLPGHRCKQGFCVPKEGAPGPG